MTCAKAPPRARGRGLLEAGCSLGAKSGKKKHGQKITLKKTRTEKHLKKTTVKKPLSRKDRGIFEPKQRLNPEGIYNYYYASCCCYCYCYYHYYCSTFCCSLWCSVILFRLTRYSLREGVCIQNSSKLVFRIRVVAVLAFRPCHLILNNTFDQIFY